MLIHIPNILTKQQVAQFRAQLNQADWVDGRATVGAQGAQVKQNRQLATDNPIARELGDFILSSVHNNAMFMAAALPLRTVPPLFNCYEGGEHYGLHVDGAIRAVANRQLALRTDISCTLFLSEPEEYLGGELIVQDTYGNHQVKLPAGDVILYPASSLHKVEPVTSGTRVCSFFWVQSMVRDAWLRSMLYELDGTIQSLRGRYGDTSEVLSLTGHYHNLLRQWSDM